MRIILLIISACLLILTEARRPAQYRPRVSEPQVYYEEDDNQAAEDGFGSPIYQPRTRALPSPRSKDTIQASKQPPVQTIRNYNKVNDDGSFTFGYEAADGSFKEETRGTDCVVRGKYGYIDPDGNKREFTYVSGNPCDPNAPKEEDDDLPEKQEEEELGGPANYPAVRPIPRPIRPTYQPTTPRPATTIFQTDYQLDDEASQELDVEGLKPGGVQLKPSAFRRPQPSYPVTPLPSLYDTPVTPSPSLYRLASTSASQYQSTSPPVLRTQPTIASTVYQPLESTTRRPATRHPRPQSVAITPRPHVAQVAAQYVSPSSTERPGTVYPVSARPTTTSSSSAVTLSPHLRTTVAATPGTSAAAHLGFAAELERYVNSVGLAAKPVQSSSLAPIAPQASSLASSGRPKLPPAKAAGSPASADPIYQSELIYDPSTGQYNTQLYQTLPQTVGDFSLSHKLQPFVAQPQSLLGLQQLQPLQPLQSPRPSPVYKAQQPLQPHHISAQSAPAPSLTQPQQALYKKQQSQLLQQSQQLYAQQQRRQQQQQQPQKLQLLESQPQSFYYVSAGKPAGSAGSAGSAGPLSIGQIDQFLRGASGGY